MRRKERNRKSQANFCNNQKEKETKEQERVKVAVASSSRKAQLVKGRIPVRLGPREEKMPHAGASSSAYSGYYASAATLSASGDSSATQDSPTAVWGYIAVTLSLIYKVPQIIHLYRTGDVAAISITR